MKPNHIIVSIVHGVIECVSNIPPHVTIEVREFLSDTDLKAYAPDEIHTTHTEEKYVKTFFGKKTVSS